MEQTQDIDVARSDTTQLLSPFLMALSRAPVVSSSTSFYERLSPSRGMLERQPLQPQLRDATVISAYPLLTMEHLYLNRGAWP